MLCTKINNKCSNIHQKTTLKSMLQCGSIFDPTWLDFGKVLGVKMAPRWHQIASKIYLKIAQKKDHLLDRLKIDFSPILGPNLGGPGAVGRLFGLLKLSWSQDEPKSFPRSPKTLPRALLEPIFDDFGLQLNGFYTQLE